MTLHGVRGQLSEVESCLPLIDSGSLSLTNFAILCLSGEIICELPENGMSLLRNSQWERWECLCVPLNKTFYVEPKGSELDHQTWEGRSFTCWAISLAPRILRLNFMLNDDIWLMFWFASLLLRPAPLHTCCRPWWLSHDPGIPNTLGSPLKLNLHSHWWPLFALHGAKPQLLSMSPLESSKAAPCGRLLYITKFDLQLEIQPWLSTLNHHFSGLTLKKYYNTSLQWCRSLLNYTGVSASTNHHKLMK